MSGFNLKVSQTAVETSRGLLKASEAVTKKELNFIAVETLRQAENGHIDAQAMNHTVEVLTRANQKILPMFWEAMLPCSWDSETESFGKNIDGKKAKLKRVEARKAFLASGGTFWQWLDTNVKVEKKDVDWSKRITTAIKSGIDEKKGGLDKAQIIKAVLEGGLTPADFMSILQPVVNTDPTQPTIN